LDPDLVLVCLAGSPLLEWAQARGLATVAEAFADRAYTPQGQLVSRSQPGAVLHEPDQVAGRMLRLVQTGTIEAIDGSVISLRAESICVHGDSSGAVQMARQVRHTLAQAGVPIQPFAGRAAR